MEQELASTQFGQSKDRKAVKSAIFLGERQYVVQESASTQLGQSKNTQAFKHAVF